MRNKKGISLIVLVVTIIVIIILAGAVILSLTQNNPIEEANKARYSNDKVTVASAINLFLGKVMAANAGNTVTVQAGTLGASGTAKYVIGTTEHPFVFEVGEGKVGIVLPTYNGATTNWAMDANGNVTLEINGVTI